MNSRTITGLPLFPLGTVLFPQGLLPLQIFEVRYLTMIGRCQRDGTPFGVVSLVSGSEVAKAGPAGTGTMRRSAAPGSAAPPPEVLQAVGTLARIVEFAAPMPGLMYIRCVGEERFRIRRQEKLPYGLWVADVECLAPDQSVRIPDDLAPAAQKLGRLIKTLQTSGIPADEMPLRAPYALEDCGWVANRWSELLPVAPALKQDLLEQESPVLRLELINDLLERTDLPF